MVQGGQKHLADAVGGVVFLLGSARQNGCSRHDDIHLTGACGGRLLPKGGCRKAADQNQGAAARHGTAQGIHQGIDVKQGQHTHQAFIGLQVHAMDKRFSGQQIAALAVHDPFGKPGGARCVDDHAGTVCKACARAGIGLARHPLLEQ